MRIAVLGAGSYGTCLALHLHRLGHAVSLWTRQPSFADKLRRDRENHTYLPGCAIDEAIVITSEADLAVAAAEIVVGVTPSHAVRAVFQSTASHLLPNTIVVNASKGLEEGTLSRIDEIYKDVLEEVA